MIQSAFYRLIKDKQNQSYCVLSCNYQDKPAFLIKQNPITKIPEVNRPRALVFYNVFSDDENIFIAYFYLSAFIAATT